MEGVPDRVPVVDSDPVYPEAAAAVGAPSQKRKKPLGPLVHLHSDDDEDTRDPSDHADADDAAGYGSDSLDEFEIPPPSKVLRRFKVPRVCFTCREYFAESTGFYFDHRTLRMSCWKRASRRTLRTFYEYMGCFKLVPTLLTFILLCVYVMLHASQHAKLTSPTHTSPTQVACEFSTAN